MRLLLLLICLLGYNSDSFATTNWHQVADFGSFGRHRGTGVGIANKAYCGLGHLNGALGVDIRFADWWEYDPASNSWAQKADYIGNNGLGEQDPVIMGLETVAYVGLGEMDQNGFYKYDTQTNSWTQVTSPPAGQIFHNEHGFTIGHKGYFPVMFSTLFWEYDADLDAWTMLASMPMSTGFGNPTFAIGDKGYISVGNAFFEYDPATNVWTGKAAYPGLFPNRPKGIHRNGKGYFIGGMNASWIWCREVWEYDPNLDTWTQGQDFPGTTRRWATVVNVNDHVYYGLGTNGTNFNDFWEYDPLGGLDEFDISSFKTYPNPAIDRVNFTSDKYQEFEIEINDLLGSSVTSSSAINGEVKINCQHLSSGTYIYNIIIKGEKVHSDRIVFI